MSIANIFQKWTSNFKKFINKLDERKIYHKYNKSYPFYNTCDFFIVESVDNKSYVLFKRVGSVKTDYILIDNQSDIDRILNAKTSNDPQIIYCALKYFNISIKNHDTIDDNYTSLNELIYSFGLNTFISLTDYLNNKND